MVHLIWSILNIVLFLYFIVICYNATKFIRQQIGVWAAIIFVFGLFSFIGRPSNDENIEPNTREIKTWKFASSDSLALNEQKSKLITLEKTTVATYNLFLIYGKDKVGKIIIPLSANSSLHGLTSGILWQPKYINVRKSANNKIFHYRAGGIVEWKLLGFNFYSQVKNYSGQILLD